MNFAGFIAKKLTISEQHVSNCIKLLDEAATIPFIARYRKEMTGSLDEVVIGVINDEYKSLQELLKRKESILKSIADQGKLTELLKKKITQCMDSVLLEDIYLPYKLKRKTRAAKARELGLEGLAKLIFEQCKGDINQEAVKFLSDDVTSIDDALAGARDIVAELVSEDGENRQQIRSLFKRKAEVEAKLIKGKEKEGEKYRDYFEFSQDISSIPSHRVLALFRAEREKIIRLDLAVDSQEACTLLEKKLAIKNCDSARQLREAIGDSYKRLIKPSIESEFRNIIKKKADNDAIAVFADNVRELLLASPLGEKRVLAIDPGFRTGCKVVILDEKGEIVDNGTIYPHPPQNKKNEAIEKIRESVERYTIEAIAVGNGTAGRETEQLLRQEFKEIPLFLVSEQGASIYSASKIAREEFPDYDITVRGAVSIGRRLVDPLAELVKIDPKSVGVGQYQHDVDQKDLRKSLDTVVESCVNLVGVNLNSASPYLLEHVSGIGPVLAKNIVQFRREHGAFKKRSELKKVPKMGEKAFELCAGFLRIVGGTNLLDNTGVHPESYSIVKEMAKDLGTKLDKMVKDSSLLANIELNKYINDTVGLPTLKDIIAELKQPGRDPREIIESFEFDQNITSIEDLKDGMSLPGIVTNVTKFGAFIDIGIKENGLVHISKLSQGFVSDPSQVVKVNQKVQVSVTEVDLERGRVALSMID